MENQAIKENEKDKASAPIADWAWWIYWIAPKVVLKENDLKLTTAWIQRENEASKVLKYTSLITCLAQAFFFYLDRFRPGFDLNFAYVHRGISFAFCFICFLMVQLNLFKKFDLRFVIYKASFLLCGLVLSALQFALMFKNPDVPRIYPAAIFVVTVASSGIGPMNTTLFALMHTGVLAFFGALAALTTGWHGAVSDISYQFIALILGFVIASKYTLHAKLFVASWKETNRVSTLFQDTKKWGDHAFTELTKLVYPHVVKMIHEGNKIENTMPVGQKNAYCTVLDVIGSSKIFHENFPIALEKFFGRCFEIMNEGYDEAKLLNTAYRVKDLGDGFIATTGFPFSVPSTRSGAVVSVEMATRFVEEFHSHMETLEYGSPISCAIGIAFGDLEGYFPTSGTKQYDLRGRALILATRYESLRKVIQDEILPGHSVIILSEAVFANLPVSYKGKFQEVDLASKDIVVRDDPSAKKVYIQCISSVVRGMRPQLSADFKNVA